MPDIPQTSFQNNQNFVPDIQKMYKSFVTGGNTPNDNETGENVGIDDLRATISVNVTGQTTKNLISSLNINPTSNTIAPTPNNSTPVQLAQESRCHTFYRIIGFPVVSSDKSMFYNPGLDVVKKIGLDRKITLSTKITIAGNVGAQFEKLSQIRENYSNNTAQVFNVPQSVEAGVLSLMSGTYGSKGNVNKRIFALPFAKSDDPFDFDVNNQVNSVSISSTYSLVGTKEVLLADYQDANGVKANTNITNPSVFQQHPHIIKPFMVDPRIDFSIWSGESKSSSGLSKRVAVPFVPDANFLKVSSTSFAERPLLEKIITDRFSQSNNTIDSGKEVQSVIDYVQNFKTIQSINIGNTTISQIFSNSVFKLSEQAAFAQCLSIIQAMMDKLVESMCIIHAVQGQYYWLPVPSISGPEGGSSVRPVPLNKNISTDLITPSDFNIIYNQSQTLLSSINSSVAQANTTPDTGGFAFNSFFNHKLTFDSTTTDAQGDLSAQTMETLLAKRNRFLTKAGDALQTVEMIMGEYSGLGLCDIIAVVGALSVMPRENLLGFLDEDAIVRAEKSLGQSLSSQRPPNISIAMNSLSSTVKGFYLIMDQVFQDYLNNNALNF